jgi:hypothetical protein
MKIQFTSTAVLLLALVATGATAARADVIIRRVPVMVAPTSRVIIQPAQQYVRRTVISAPSQLELMTQPAVIAPESPVLDRTITQEVLISPALSGIENFRSRLNAISSQIALGQSRGWLTSASAAGFQAEYQALASRADELLSRAGGTKPEGDLLELDINVLNQKVTDMMAHPSM